MHVAAALAVEQAHLYVTKRGHVSARCRLSPEEELLVLDKASKLASVQMAAAIAEAEGASADQLGVATQAARYGTKVLGLTLRG